MSVLTAVAVLAPACPAAADNGAVDRFALTDPVDFAPGREKVIVETTLTLAAGESRHLRGRLEATSSTNVIVAMNASIKCYVGETLIGVAGTTSRNHEGFDTKSYATEGHLPLLVDLLFTAPSAGSYRCGLYGLTATRDPNLGHHLTALDGGATWLDVSRDDQAGAHWWQGRECNSTGTSATCSYIGPGQPDAMFVFYEDGAPHDQWTVRDDTTDVQALANVTMTTCPKTSKSCDVDESVRNKRVPGSKSVVKVQLQVLQMNTAGTRTCATTTTPETTKTIFDDAHHYTAYLELPSVHLSEGCGRQFMMRVRVEHVSGSPVKIDGLQAPESLTSGIMMMLPPDPTDQ